MMSFDWFLNAKKKSPFVTEHGVLPISVVLVVVQSRLNFIHSFVLPSIRANNPAEIIVVDDDDLNNQEKRNKGAYQATQKYLFVCDDDVVMPAGHLFKLYQALELEPEYSFAYTDYQAIVMDPETHPKEKNYYQKSRGFDLEYLKFNNYIDTCNLIRTDCFPGFDPEIKRLQDWDLWLAVSLKGHKGKYITDTGIIKFYLDAGITSKSTSVLDSRNIILEKYGLSGYLSILFFDVGKGFNQQNSIARSVSIEDGLFEVEFDLSGIDDIKKIRFDPVESRACVISNLEVYYLCSDDYIPYQGDIGSNSYSSSKGAYKFNTLDPQLYLALPSTASAVKFKGQIYFDLNTDSLFSRFFNPAGGGLDKLLGRFGGK